MGHTGGSQKARPKRRVDFFPGQSPSRASSSADYSQCIIRPQLLDSKANTLHLDLINEASIQDASKAFGGQPLDILINCAGM